MMTVDQVAETLHISRGSLSKIMGEEGFPRFRVGRRILIPEGMFSEWIKRKVENGHE